MIRPSFKGFTAALLIAVALAAPNWTRAGGMTDYLENKLIDHVFRGINYTAPSVLAVALIRATRGFWASGTVYAVNDTVIPNAANGRIYKATAVAGTGTSGATEPTWPTSSAGTVVDNAGANQITWTEQTIALEAGTFTEVANAGSYARASLNPSASNWKGTGNETSGASGGTSGTTKSNTTITYAAPTATWGVIFGYVIVDSATYGAGTALFYAALTTPKTINNGDLAPSFAVDALTVQVDN